MMASIICLCSTTTMGQLTTRPDFEWSNYPGVGSYNEGETSYFYEYLVNENDKSYELVKSFEGSIFEYCK